MLNVITTECFTEGLSIHINIHTSSQSFECLTKPLELKWHIFVIRMFSFCALTNRQKLRNPSPQQNNNKQHMTHVNGRSHSSVQKLCRHHQHIIISYYVCDTIFGIDYKIDNCFTNDAN